MKKSLVALLVGLSSCVSQQQCPTDSELLKAGFKIFSASKMLESKKKTNHDLARTTYDVTSEYYFKCSNGDMKHKQKHYDDAVEKIEDYLGLSNEQRRNFDLNILKIKDEIDLNSYTKR